VNRLGIVIEIGKEAAALTAPVRRQLLEWEQQFIDPIEYGTPGESEPSPIVKAQIQESMPEVDPDEPLVPAPKSYWPSLVALTALLAVGGGFYMLGRNQNLGKPK